MNLFENLQSLKEDCETASVDELVHCNDCETCFDKNYATTTRDDENDEWLICPKCGAWCKPEERYDNVKWADESERDIDEEYENVSIKKEDINNDLRNELNSYTKQINDKINEMYNNAVKSGVSEEAASENIEQCLNHWTAELSATTPPLAQYWNDNKFFMLYGNWFDILPGDIETTDKDFEYAIKDAKALLNTLSKYLKN